MGVGTRRGKERMDDTGPDMRICAGGTFQRWLGEQRVGFSVLLCFLRGGSVPVNNATDNQQTQTSNGMRAYMKT